METTKLLDRTREIWDQGIPLCRGFFNLGLDNIGDENKLEDGTQTGLEGLPPEEWWEDQNNRIFVKSVRSLVESRINIIQLLTSIQTSLGTMQFPSWRRWGRLGDGSLYEIQNVRFASDIQPWSYGHQILEPEISDGSKKDTPKIAGIILGNLKAENFNTHTIDCREHLLQNEKRWKEWFDKLAGLLGVQDPLPKFLTMKNLRKLTGLKNRAIKSHAKQAGIIIDKGTDKRTRGFPEQEAIRLLKHLSEHTELEVSKNATDVLKSMSNE